MRLVFFMQTCRSGYPPLRHASNRNIRIERAHQLHSNVTTEKDVNRPCTLIFKLLVGLYSDHQAILKGARARPVKHDGQSLLFFPDYSKETMSKMRNFALVHKKMTSFGLQTFLLYPARLKITYRGQIYLATRNEAEDFLLNTFQLLAALHARVSQLHNGKRTKRYSFPQHRCELSFPLLDCI